VFLPPPVGPGVWQLDNLADDPGETRDLAEDDPSRLAALIADWAAYAAEIGVAVEEETPEMPVPGDQPVRTG
jgi:arylsulfatase